MTLTKFFGFGFTLSASKAPGLAAMFALAKQRRALARLDKAALIDMGLTQADVDREVKRPAWDVPASWRH